MAEIYWIEVFRSRGARLTNTQVFSGYVERAKVKRKLQGGQLAAIANGRPVNQGRRWSKKDDAKMGRLSREGLGEHAIADALGRSVGAVVTRLAQSPAATS